MTKMPNDFAAFMSSADNKRQLITFMLSEWQQSRYANSLHDRTIFFVYEESCIALHSPDRVSVVTEDIRELASSQEEADTRIILHCVCAASSLTPDGVVVVKSSDTDVFVLLLAHHTNISVSVVLVTGTGNNKRMLSIDAIHDSIGSEVAAALPGFHAFTGCDTTSCFVRKGKRKPY